MGRLFRTLGRKLRGILGLGVIGGGIGFVGGALWGFAAQLLRTGVFLDGGYWVFVLQSALAAGVGMMIPATITSAGFGLLLAAADSKRSIGDLPLWRMALFGGLIGAALPPLVIISRLGWVRYLEIAPALLPAMGVLAALGGGLTSSMVALAKRADRLAIGERPQTAATRVIGRSEPAPRTPSAGG